MSEIISLETLPPLIQDSIFQYLQTPVLLKLCLLSEKLYWAAAGQLYKSITVTTKLHCQMAKLERKCWNLNYGTVLKHKTFEKLVDTLIDKPKLGELVHKFTLHRKVVFDKYALLLFLAHTPHLLEFHNFSRFQIPPATAEKLQRVTCVLGQSLKHAKCLRELRIRDFNDDISEISYDGESDDEIAANITLSANESPRSSDADSYKRLAKDLVELGAYANLKKLHISSAQVAATAYCRGQFFTRKYSDNWFCFFAELNALEIKFNLDAMAIHGVALGRADDVAKLIRGSVNLRELKQLILVHDNCESHHPELSFLGLLTKKTPHLKSLAVEFAFQHHELEVESLVEVLEQNIPHQLKDLSVCMTRRAPLRARYAIQQCIGETQRNLARVRIEDSRPLIARTDPLEASPNPDPYNVDDVLTEIHNHNRCALDFENDRRHLFPDVISDVHFRSTISDEHLAVIKRGMKKVAESISLDLVYKHAHWKLPQLAQYYVGGLHFNMKKRGIFIHDTTITFERENQKRPAPTDLGLTEEDRANGQKRSRESTR